MDEVLKRRLLGAAVLLLAAFGLASLLPDPAHVDPARDGRVVTYDLATGKPVAVPSEAPTEAPGDVSRAEAPEAAPRAARPALKVDETLSADRGQWYVQIASFENASNAHKAQASLYALELPATVQPVSVGKTLWHRVRVGPYPDEAGAQRALATVRKQGYPLARLVRPDAASDRGGN